MTIKDIYHGNACPLERRFADGSDYMYLTREWLKLNAKFESSLTEQQKNVFNRLCDIQGEQSSITNERYYQIGFRDGAELVLDILRGEMI